MVQRVFTDTICAPATPPGEGAVALVRLSGPAALAILQALSRRDRFVPRRLTAVTLRRGADDVVLDRALACFMPGPASYTGEDVVELFAHGGTINLAQIQTECLLRGARLAEPGEFTRRAFLSGRLDLTQAEAVAEVIAAKSERALRNAQGLLAGELGRRVRALRQEGVELAAELEARLDFAEELEAAVPEGRLRGGLRGLVERVTALAESYERGRRLGGAAVALVGPVNAGKSSLLNALLGTRRALVSEEEGTTRDYLEVEVQWEGQRVILVDTAGLRAESVMSPLEREGRALGEERASACELLLGVVDGAAAARDASLGTAFGEVDLVLVNKVDLLEAESRREVLCSIRAHTSRPVLEVSARTGEGLADLRYRILESLSQNGAAGDAPETVLVTQARQFSALERARVSLLDAETAREQGLGPEFVVEHVRLALAALAELTGEGAPEEVLDALFARFCIGK
ncbi:MAG: tRNA uridine-5-carboxymethylaminomethyl(34) synthesis GTPase MnmE [Deltaproteobacteria bacterium]|nr:tRNA uridine-5-carboxymethylaminomethyl(34) synthesis GTPase MnmE [Deltaproteobacteria bacterium]